MGDVMFVLGAPELIVMRYILWSIAGVYVFAALLSWLGVFVRNRLKRKTPRVEAMVYWAWLLGFFLQLVLPLWTLVQMLMTGEYSSSLYLVPYAVVSGLCILMIFWVFSKTRHCPSDADDEQD
jgi:hypothetical protein